MNDLICPYCSYENDIADYTLIDNYLESEGICNGCESEYNFKIEMVMEVKTWVTE